MRKLRRVKESLPLERDHPDNSIPPGSLTVLFEIYHLQNDYFKTNKDYKKIIQTRKTSKISPKSNPEEDKNKEDGRGMGCE